MRKLVGCLVMICNRRIHMKLKREIYKTVVSPANIYDAEPCE